MTPSEHPYSHTRERIGAAIAAIDDVLGDHPGLDCGEGDDVARWRMVVDARDVLWDVADELEACIAGSKNRS